MHSLGQFRAYQNHSRGIAKTATTTKIKNRGNSSGLFFSSKMSHSLLSIETMPEAPVPDGGGADLATTASNHPPVASATATMAATATAATTVIPQHHQHQPEEEEAS
jgi:hypothetical protein